ncbi:unnamed protein product [Brassica oleracea var. botrytis]|uniref:Uncharacterized protein n=1 Tax=Brassica oleracea TaxID=3712 RepID=A0A3P6FP03_BRAOL|nr:unnamed protein product [Brassica oleracea]
MARDEKTCKTNADCNGIRCPKAIIRTEYVQCIRGVCQCPSKRRVPAPTVVWLLALTIARQKEK